MRLFYSSDQAVDHYTKSIVDSLKDQLEEGDEALINSELSELRDAILRGIISEIKNF